MFFVLRDTLLLQPGTKIINWINTGGELGTRHENLEVLMGRCYCKGVSVNNCVILKVLFRGLEIK